MWVPYLSLGIAAIAAVVAAVSVPSGLEVLFGRPEVKLDFFRATTVKGVMLAVHVENMPINWRLLRKLGVRRRAAENIKVGISIRKRAPAELLSRGWIELHAVDGNRSFGGEDEPLHVLHAGLRPWASVLGHAPGKSASIRDFGAGEEEREEDIPPGEYRCTIKVEWSDGSVRASRDFLVGPSHYGTNWEGQPSV